MLVQKLRRSYKKRVYEKTRRYSKKLEKFAESIDSPNDPTPEEPQPKSSSTAAINRSKNRMKKLEPKSSAAFNAEVC